MQDIQRFNLQRGWTQALEPSTACEKLGRELKSYLDKGKPALVKMHEDVVQVWREQPEGTTAYCMSIAETKKVMEEIIEVTFIKGTTQHAESILLAYANGIEHSVIAIPLYDLRHVTNEERAERQRKIDEENAFKQEHSRVEQIIDSLQRTQTIPYYRINKVLTHMECLAQEYVRLRDAVSISRVGLTKEQYKELKKMCHTFEMNSLTANDAGGYNEQLVAFAEFKDVKIRFMPDRTPSKLHKELEGAVFNMGDIAVRVDLIHKKLLDIDFLPQYSLCVRIGAKEIRNALLHPHVQNGGNIYRGYAFGKPCWGSYEPELKKLCNSFNIYNLMLLVRDYISSCSESGWYGSVFYWANEEQAAQYCTCGYTKLTPETARCPMCAWKREDASRSLIIESVAQ